MHSPGLSFRYLSNYFRINNTVVGKFVRRKQSYELFIPIGHFLVMSKNARSFSMISSIVNTSRCNKYLLERSLMQSTQCKTRILGQPWSAQQVITYCQDNGNKSGTEVKQDHPFKDAIKKKREQLLESEQKIRKTSQNILKDIRETKEKMKERMEDVIERENVWTIPNILCVGRIIASPYLGYLILQGDFSLAIAVFAFAGITDLLDGWIARNFKNQSTKLGSFLDPMADKILVGVLFTTLTIAGHISIALTALIIARDLALVGAGFYIRYKSLPPPRTLSRYFDASLVTAQLQPTLISKINTVVQLMLVASVMAAPVWSIPSPDVLLALSYITAATTIASGLSYVFERNTYHILKKSKK